MAQTSISKQGMAPRTGAGFCLSIPATAPTACVGSKTTVKYHALCPSPRRSRSRSSRSTATCGRLNSGRSSNDRNRSSDAATFSCKYNTSRNKNNSLPQEANARRKYRAVSNSSSILNRCGQSKKKANRTVSSVYVHTTFSEHLVLVSECI